MGTRRACLFTHNRWPSILLQAARRRDVPVIQSTVSVSLAPGARTQRDLFRSRSEAFLERVKGIEPSSVAWEATALPLSYSRADLGCLRCACGDGNGG